MRDAMDKYNDLIEMLKGYGRCAVCFSGGTDSFLLLFAAKEALGRDNVFAVTLDTEFYPKEDIDYTAKTIKQLGVEHIILPLRLLDHPDLCKNDEHRCYYCKREMLRHAKQECAKRGIDHVVEGSNHSDRSDHKPSVRACAEVGVVSPLMEVELTKPEIINILSKKGFFEIVRPSDACLASRIRYDEEITPEKLKMTDIAEDYIKIFGYKVLRVRNAGGVARIELDLDDIERFKARHWDLVKKKLLELGYTDAEIAPEGYVHGSMNKPGAMENYAQH